MKAQIFRLLATVTATVLLSVPATPALAQFRGDKEAKLVVTEPVQFQNETRRVEAVGTAEAVRSVVLYPAVAEEVMEVNFVPGQQVEAGKVLVRLDDRKQLTALKRAKLQLKDAERTYQRLLNSQQQGAVAQNELDLAQTARDLAEVNVADAQADLDDRHIRAPFTGVVGLTEIEVGDRITTSTAITTLDDRSKLYINFRAPEASLPVLMNAPKVTLEPWANRNTELQAEVAQLDSRINESDRTLRVRAILDNSQDRFRPGMSFRVKLAIDGNRYAAIPEASLLWGATGAYLWTAENGKARRVDVEVHQRLRGTILVSGKLSDGDTLISEGIQRLRNGQEITTELARGPGDE
ncbi:efflux RND transporter periplasmic adaptor subunit [Alteromonas sp. ASW11-19]|uniref:Efflux RND transporter periplasmic adaptor subunit n=1 Tax=Alteromonas salexigens TaxID=2982530 RepID=A0ABT2VSI1_9ALTE|nr:efflux RND transporter periplasmic adaptor subunit [Alteromonas salexigens]MCU7555191.1 efflux RND transporter periplasmic adaptor subunit [Alteromonas salexigens]